MDGLRLRSESMPSAGKDGSGEFEYHEAELPVSMSPATYNARIRERHATYIKRYRKHLNGILEQLTALDARIEEELNIVRIAKCDKE